MGNKEKAECYYQDASVANGAGDYWAFLKGRGIEGKSNQDFLSHHLASSEG